MVHGGTNIDFWKGYLTLYKSGSWSFCQTRPGS